MTELPKIYGFNKVSEMGNNVFAPTIFLAGCNLRCPYCMNARLVKGENLKEIDISEIKEYVLENKCEWINISGGEPTITPINLLINLLDEIKSWKCKIGLSTNGTCPDVLAQILPMLDYVALDIKCIREQAIVVANKNYLLNTLRSKAKLMVSKFESGNFDYEVRTTLYPPFVDEEVIREIGSIMKSDTKWILQRFRHSQNMLDENCCNIEPYSDEQTNVLLEIAKKYCKNVQLKYV